MDFVPINSSVIKSRRFTLSLSLAVIISATLALCFITGIVFLVRADLEELPPDTGTDELTKHRRKNFEHEHIGGGGAHNVEEERRILLGGSEQAVHEFDELGPDESKKRLHVLARDRIDINKDGFVSIDELTDWVRNSMLTLDQEETRERFDEIDDDHNELVTWAEYVKESFGLDDKKDAEKTLDSDDKKLFEEDRRYFDTADLDKDGRLSMDEFIAFQNPEHAKHMHAALIQNTLAERDANRDGRIDITEYIGADFANEHANSEWVLTERNRFRDELDRDGDGFLSSEEELRAWLAPDLGDTARREAEHLISTGDTDKDGRLSLDEVVAAHQAFIGSEATNFGEHLNTVRAHEEL